jgi:hypothetical protein
MLQIERIICHTQEVVGRFVMTRHANESVAAVVPGESVNGGFREGLVIRDHSKGPLNAVATDQGRDTILTWLAATDCRCMQINNRLPKVAFWRGQRLNACMLKQATIAERPDRRWKTWLFLPALMLPLVGCSVSDDPNAWYNKTVVENLSGRSDAPPPAAPADSPNIPATPGVASIPPTPPPAGGAIAPVAAPAGSAGAAGPRALPESEFYRSEASCGGVILGTGAPPSLAASQSISLDMTECEVARRLGAPDRMELAGAGGQRLLTLTYGRGEHPRLYRFASGRLYAIEALSPPAPPARRAASPR